MTHDMQKMEQQIMAGVAGVYVARKVSSPVALKAYVLVLSCIGVVALISLPHVMANFLTVEGAGLPAVGEFIFSAILKTNVVVQLTLCVGAVTALSLLKDMFKPRSTALLA